jgi:hypothetical protein
MNMKKNQKNTKETKRIDFSRVSVSLAESRLLKNMVEELARFRQTTGFKSEPNCKGWKSLESSSLEAYVSGDISMILDGKKIDPPFVASFLFTCTRPEDGKFRLRWMNSLS